MIGGQQKFQEVLGLVQDWVPAEEYGHEREFQSELQDFLDEQLNEEGRGMMNMDQGEDVVSTEHGKNNADIAVNDQIGVEIKRDLTNSQTKKLRGQIDSYLENYDFVIVCACGVKDTDGWRELKNKFEGTHGMGQQEVAFVWKRKENYGAGTAGGREEDSGMMGGQDSLW
ncbi:MAG: hypothetical protein ABEI97_03495 [Candidatus Nanohaloarchaea archaeon]